MSKFAVEEVKEFITDFMEKFEVTVNYSSDNPLRVGLSFPHRGAIDSGPGGSFEKFKKLLDDAMEQWGIDKRGEVDIEKVSEFMLNADKQNDFQQKYSERRNIAIERIKEKIDDLENKIQIRIPEAIKSEEEKKNNPKLTERQRENAGDAVKLYTKMLEGQNQVLADYKKILAPWTAWQSKPPTRPIPDVPQVKAKPVILSQSLEKKKIPDISRGEILQKTDFAKRNEGLSQMMGYFNVQKQYNPNDPTGQSNSKTRKADIEGLQKAINEAAETMKENPLGAIQTLNEKMITLEEKLGKEWGGASVNLARTLEELKKHISNIQTTYIQAGISDHKNKRKKL